MTAAPALVEQLRLRLDGNRREADTRISELEPHDARCLAALACELLAQDVRIIEGNDRAGINAHLEGLGLLVAQMAGVSE